MPKLTDTQLVILSTAARRDSHAVLPLPESLKVNKGAATGVFKALIKKGLIEETPSMPADQHWHEDEAGHKVALTITDAGLAALDGEPAAPRPKRPKKRPVGQSKSGNTAPNKAGIILTLLSRPKGAKVSELQKATGSQAHSIRAALTGLRKRGIAITRFQDDGLTTYRAEAG